jgi:hypothetical protein
VLHLFNGNDGNEPQTGVTRGADGALYGTTVGGGSFSYTCYTYSFGCGVLFKLKNSGSAWTYTALHKFGSLKGDGEYPSGPPLLINGVLYGVTNNGGSNACSMGSTSIGCGTIYKINTDGTGYTILHNFSGGVMNFPNGSLTSDGNRNLYGTVAFGGGGTCDSTVGCGAVFEIGTDGTNFVNVHAFTGVNGNDGATPEMGVTLANGKLFGTTAGGGFAGCAIQGDNPGGCGVIFQLTPGPSSWSETILHRFSPGNGQARIPSGLSFAANGLLYGATSYGGGCGNSKFPDGCGVVFDLTTAGSYTTIHQFQGPPNDGAIPFGGTPAGPPVMPPPQAGPAGSGAGLVVDAAGAIWGATDFGGSGNCGGTGCGAVYKITGTKLPIGRHHQK